MNKYIIAILLVLSSLPHSAKAEDESHSMAEELKLRSEAPAIKEYKIENAPALSWEEQGYPERILWSQYTFGIVNLVLDDLDKAADMPKFCPNYDSLTRDQKIVAWAELFANIAYWESGFDATNHTKELLADRGTDGITHQAVYSEGLLQLSYQDIIHYGDVCFFNYEKDQKMAPDNIHKSIFNPYNNLYCGIHIMSRLTKNDHAIIHRTGYYWSTLQEGNWLEDRQAEIKYKVGELPFCGGKGKESIGDYILRKIRGIGK